MPSPAHPPGVRGHAASVHRIGFRKWYERQLLSSHAHMVLTFLAAIGLLGSFEAMRGATQGEGAINLLGVLACAGIGLWALRRYLFLLTRAEDAANQATCGQCGDYGRFRVVGGGGTPQDTQVSCRKCTNTWSINLHG